MAEKPSAAARWNWGKVHHHSRQTLFHSPSLFVSVSLLEPPTEIQDEVCSLDLSAVILWYSHDYSDRKLNLRGSFGTEKLLIYQELDSVDQVMK